MSIIGISGRIGSGKDTVGKIIEILTDSPHFTTDAVVEFLDRDILDPKWQVKKFADTIKDMVCMMLDCTRKELEDREFKEKELGEEWWKVSSCGTGTLNDYLSSKHLISPEDTIIKITPRLLLQLLGTECGRQILHPNIWVNSLMSGYKFMDTNGVRYPKWIITDLRFPNEVKSIQDRGGLTIRIERPARMNYFGSQILTGKPEQEHESETALDDAEFDFTINNDGSLHSLVEEVRQVMKTINLIPV